MPSTSQSPLKSHMTGRVIALGDPCRLSLVQCVLYLNSATPKGNVTQESNDKKATHRDVNHHDFLYLRDRAIVLNYKKNNIYQESLIFGCSSKGSKTFWVPSNKYKKRQDTGEREREREVM